MPLNPVANGAEAAQVSITSAAVHGMLALQCNYPKSCRRADCTTPACCTRENLEEPARRRRDARFRRRPAAAAAVVTGGCAHGACGTCGTPCSGRNARAPAASSSPANGAQGGEEVVACNRERYQQLQIANLRRIQLPKFRPQLFLLRIGYWASTGTANNDVGAPRGSEK